MEQGFGLSIQGGGTRASFCLGAALELKERGLLASAVSGTSAGSLIGLMYLLKESEGVEEAFIDYMGNRQFVGLSNVIRHGGLFNFSFFYDDLAKNRKEIDLASFESSDIPFVAVATGCNSGKATYFEKGKCDIYKAIEASCALPLFSRPVEIDGEGYLDGGTTDPIPYGYLLGKGLSKVIVVSSRPKGYTKAPQKRSSKVAAKAFYSKYPNWQKAFAASIDAYNREVEAMAKDEEDGKIFVIYPKTPIALGVAETDAFRLYGAIYLGRKAVRENIGAIMEYLCR